jgi:hypothetical protein
VKRLLFIAPLLSLGCGVELDRPHEVQGLRILGVHKSAPYARPGETVELSMLWHDGSKSAPRPVSVAWFAGCFNPPGDLFYNCFAALQGAAPGPGGGPPDGIEVGFGDRFAFTMPETIIDARPPPLDPRFPPYGLAYVFFAACAGQLGPPPPESGSPFPIGCFGPDGNALGPDDFVAGYSAIYAYREFRNRNPEVGGFAFNGVETPHTCIGEECLGVEPPVPDCTDQSFPCVYACPEDGSREDCPGYSIRPLLDPSIAERDSVSEAAYGTSLLEQMWIRYFTDRGSIDSDVRLLNDALEGWHADYGTTFRAPKEPGIVNLWAVVYDNRGGIGWVRQQVVVQ